MAEEGGLTAEALGAGEPEARDLGAASGIDPVAAGLAALSARLGAPLDPQLSSYLAKQEKLVELQTEHMHEQREVLLSTLRLRRTTDRLKLGLQLFFALAATVVGLGVLVMLYDAFTSRAVVVDAFKAPSALAGRGVTGEVVASDVLDALQQMQQATRATDKARETHGAWASDIKVEVPDTGVSIGEIDRMLHQRFGHDLHIDGELVQTDTGGLAITVRGEGVPAATFTGDAGDLGKLTVKAAEYVYGRSQPNRYASYLEDAGRDADAVDFLQGAYPRATNDKDRAKLAHDWGNAELSLNRPGPAAEKYRLAMGLVKPRAQPWWTSWGNLVGAIEESQGEEAGWREGHALLQAVAAAPKEQRPALRLLDNPAQVTWDLPLMQASNLDDAKLNGGAGGDVSSPDGTAIADTYGLMHEPALAERALASADPADPATKAETLLLPAYAALDQGDAKAAAGPLDAFYKAWLAAPNLQFTFNTAPCFTGLADGLTGRLKDAEAVFQRLNGQSLCAAMHGDVLVHAGDVAGAERVWAEGQKAFPDLPTIPLHRGLYELGKGDLKAAEADVSAAAAKAPHWADPWKAWGDVLAREGQWTAALARYDEALKYAPQWTALHQARDAAAQHRLN